MVNLSLVMLENISSVYLSVEGTSSMEEVVAVMVSMSSGSSMVGWTE